MNNARKTLKNRDTNDEKTGQNGGREARRPAVWPGVGPPDLHYTGRCSAGTVEPLPARQINPSNKQTSYSRLFFVWELSLGPQAPMTNSTHKIVVPMQDLPAGSQIFVCPPIARRPLPRINYSSSSILYYLGVFV